MRKSARDVTMRLNLTKMSIPLNAGFLIAFFLLMWLSFEAHEFSHYVAVLVQGGKLYAAFNEWQQIGLSDLQSGISVAVAPLTTYTLMWIGMFMLLKSKKYGLLGFSLIFANTPLFRITGPGYVLSGDERIIAGHLGISPLLFLLVILLIVSPPLTVAYKSIRNKRRLLWFLFFFLLTPILFAIATLVPDKFFLSPVVEQSYETGVPLTPMVLGIPIVIIIMNVIVVVLFFGVYIRHLLSPNGNIMNV